MLGNGRPSGTGIGEKGDTDRGLLPLTDQQFRHRRKLHNGFKVLVRAILKSIQVPSKKNQVFNLLTSQGVILHLRRLPIKPPTIGTFRLQHSRYRLEGVGEANLNSGGLTVLR